MSRSPNMPEEEPFRCRLSAHNKQMLWAQGENDALQRTKVLVMGNRGTKTVLSQTCRQRSFPTPLDEICERAGVGARAADKEECRIRNSSYLWRWSFSDSMPLSATKEAEFQQLTDRLLASCFFTAGKSRSARWRQLLVRSATVPAKRFGDGLPRGVYGGGPSQLERERLIRREKANDAWTLVY